MSRFERHERRGFGRRQRLAFGHGQYIVRLLDRYEQEMAIRDWRYSS